MHPLVLLGRPLSSPGPPAGGGGGLCWLKTNTHPVYLGLHVWEHLERRRHMFQVGPGHRSGHLEPANAFSGEQTLTDDL